ncbi:glycoside hydrolase family 17 protein [Serendipita vermifera MAFF 305830]|uniref:glucan endo-1,3-beta-D-glucosidase n=1 Tax=Serendipita vermifera MAFF 305830 TaxID=933852 RepID=A0A0C2WV40_SERVB|nr:glycoside hydrolase family 17 protein [Serendipita vermifera MAFF 305830]
MKSLSILLTAALFCLKVSKGSETPQQVFMGNSTTSASNCFPALDFPVPKAPGRPPAQWWCSPSDTNGFLGFTYETDGCQSASTLLADFTRMRNDYKARYVRLYGWCDDQGTYLNNVIQAAYSAGLGVYFTIWFGFDGGNAWIRRRDLIIGIVRKNPFAPYVVRSIDVGSEPLYDWALQPPQAVADQIKFVRSQVGPFGIQVSISEMQYGYSVQGPSQMVLDAEDVVHAHELAFFDKDAKTGADAGPSLISSTKWFVSKTNNTRKIIFTQTGWPTNTKVWKGNSPKAVASLESTKAFAKLLDDSCETFKGITPLGGVGWFWHIWSDSMLEGWGVLDQSGKPKWTFAPRTSC